MIIMHSVAHVVSSLAVGGAERLVVDLASAQRRTGLMTWIVDLGREPGPLASVALSHGVPVIHVGRSRSRLRRAVMLARLLVPHADPVTHLHNPWALRAVLPVLPLVPGRVFYTRHGASPYNTATWRAMHTVARRFIRRATFVTDDARRSFEGTHGDWRGVVIENGVALALAPPPRVSVDRLRLGLVGRLVELKGQRLVLDAVAALAPDVRARVELHLFGDGPERERLAEQAATQLAGVPVVFHGTVLDREQIYAAIDVLVVGSRTEGLSMAVMEAMARAVPVIATDVGGNRGLVRDGDTGLLVPNGDVAAIRDSIARFVAEPALTVRMGRAAHELIATRYSITAIAERYRTLYDERQRA
jgi:glycosyltransferase involved in cell wall biosynthesis